MATIGSLTVPDEDQCHLVWRAPAWLDEHQGHVTASTALAYFCLSPFFDRRSTNQTLRMQTMFSGQAQLEPKAEAEALRRFVGTEYALVEGTNVEGAAAGRENAFVIEKRERKGPDEVYPIATYLIIRGSIYQSPTIYTVLATRLRTSLLALDEMLRLARAARPAFSTRNGYAWRIKAAQSEATPGKAVEAVAEGATDGEAAMDIDVALPTTIPSTSSTKTQQVAPSDAFNPLLSRALDSTFTQLHAPPPVVAVSTHPVAAGRSHTRTPSVAPSTPAATAQAAGTPRPTGSEPPAQKPGPGAVVTSTVEGQKVAYRIGPTGKRKPRPAA